MWYIMSSFVHKNSLVFDCPHYNRQPHEFHTPADYFRQQYYEIFDVLFQEI